MGDNTKTTDYDPFAELVKERSPELFSGSCGIIPQRHPIEPVHGHFMCSACHIPTKCCEGGPISA